ncbi:MAG: efflux RND transporter periplasmic adaptor subunit [Burkholderiaceae bacterium]
MSETSTSQSPLPPAPPAPAPLPTARAPSAGVTAALSQRENIQANAARTLELVSKGFLSEVKADDARAAQRNADSQLQKAQAELERAMITTGGRNDANPELRTAQLQLEQAQLNRRFATLTAPTRGVVTNLRLAIGQYVAVGTPAMTFIDAGDAWITADLRENQLGNVYGGDRVGVVFDAALPEGQWFEPARRIPVHVELEGGLGPRGRGAK